MAFGAETDPDVRIEELVRRRNDIESDIERLRADVLHLTWLQRMLGDRLLDAAVVTTGPTAYRRPDGIAVIPAALLGP